MSMQMMTIKLAPKKANLAQVRRAMKLAPGEIDESFGVVSIDPKKNLYAIMVDETATRKLAGKGGVKGPFSNPRIEPFGPPH